MSTQDAAPGVGACIATVGVFGVSIASVCAPLAGGGGAGGGLATAGADAGDVAAVDADVAIVGGALACSTDVAADNDVVAAEDCSAGAALSTRLSRILLGLATVSRGDATGGKYPSPSMINGRNATAKLQNKR